MFKKLKKRLEGDEGQPALLGKPGIAVRSSINDSSSNVVVESSQDFVASNDEQQASSETDNGLSNIRHDDTELELKEASQFKTNSQRSGMFVYKFMIC